MESETSSKQIIILEGFIKYLDNKKWKPRWAIITKLSPIADCLQIIMYKNFKEKSKKNLATPKTILELEHYLGIESGFTFEKESNTMAIICIRQTCVVAFETREIQLQWQAKIQENFCIERHFLVHVVNVPNNTSNNSTKNVNNNKNDYNVICGPARLLLQDSIFCLVNGIPPRLNFYWSIKQLRRFGIIDGKFCFEGGSKCGKGAGLHVLYTSQPEELSRYFELASNEQLNNNNSLFDTTTKTNRPLLSTTESSVNGSELKNRHRSITSSDSSTGDSSSQLMSCFDDALSTNYYLNESIKNNDHNHHHHHNCYHSSINLNQKYNNLHLDCPDTLSQQLNNSNNQQQQAYGGKVHQRSCVCPPLSNISSSNNAKCSFSSNTISRFSNIKPDLIECHQHHNNNNNNTNSISNHNFVCYHHPSSSTAATLRQVKHSITSTSMIQKQQQQQPKIINCDHESLSFSPSSNDSTTTNTTTISSSNDTTGSGSYSTQVLPEPANSSNRMCNSSLQSDGLTTNGLPMTHNGGHNYSVETTSKDHLNFKPSANVNGMLSNNDSMVSGCHTENRIVYGEIRKDIDRKQHPHHHHHQHHYHHHQHQLHLHRCDEMNTKESIGQPYPPTRPPPPYHRINFNNKTASNSKNPENTTAMENYDIPKNLCMNSHFSKPFNNSDHIPLSSEQLETKNSIIMNCICHLTTTESGFETAKQQQHPIQKTDLDDSSSSSNGKICLQNSASGLKNCGTAITAADTTMTTKYDRHGDGFLKGHNCFQHQHHQHSSNVCNGTIIIHRGNDDGTCGGTQTETSKEQEQKNFFQHQQRQCNGYCVGNQCDLSNVDIITINNKKQEETMSEPNRIMMMMMENNNNNNKTEMNYQNMYFINTMQLYENLCFFPSNIKTNNQNKTDVVVVADDGTIVNGNQKQESKNVSDPIEDHHHDHVDDDASTNNKHKNNSSLSLSNIQNENVTTNNNGNSNSNEEDVKKCPSTKVVDLMVPINSTTKKEEEQEIKEEKSREDFVPTFLLSINDGETNMERRMMLLQQTPIQNGNEQQQMEEKSVIDTATAALDVEKEEENPSRKKQNLVKCGNHDNDYDEDRFCSRQQEPELGKLPAPSFWVFGSDDDDNENDSENDYDDQAVKCNDSLQMIDVKHYFRGADSDADSTITNLIRRTLTNNRQRPRPLRQRLLRPFFYYHSSNSYYSSKTSIGGFLTKKSLSINDIANFLKIEQQNIQQNIDDTNPKIIQPIFDQQEKWPTKNGCCSFNNQRKTLSLHTLFNS